MDATRSVDVWRSRHPGALEFTWHRPNGLQSSRLDMIWAPDRFSGLVQRCDILPFFRSDHNYVFLQINLPFNISYRSSYWKLNTSLLRHAELQSQIRAFWAHWRLRKCTFMDPRVWWDGGKIYVKQIIHDYSTTVAARRNCKFRLLSTKLRGLNAKWDAGDLSVRLVLEQTRAELDHVLSYRARGARVRARLQWAAEGESSTKFFLNYERKRAQQQLVSGVYRSDGSLATDLTDVIDTFSAFYQDLFTSQALHEPLQNKFISSLERVLSATDAAACEGPLTLDECFSALKLMSRGKTPGLDGLPCEFYLSFWDILGADFVDLANYSYQVGSMSPSMCRGVICLLFKKGDQLEAGNWRPITLLGVDYKIIARVLAKRLLLVIAKVISPDQTCGVPGRFVGENLALLRDIIIFATENNIATAVISFDQAKAFDRVEWGYLRRVLCAMGFGPSFQRWVEVLYAGAQSAVQVNGYLSCFFSVGRGVRQGCPLSPLLYVLVAETLACTIRADSDIVGFRLPCSNIQAKLSQYADDTTAITTSERSLSRIFVVFSEYELASGAKLNIGKCHGLWLGAWANRVDSPAQIVWSNSSICILGAVLGPRLPAISLWRPILRRVESALAAWSSHRLSFSGKVTIINCLIVPKLWYLASVFILPPDILRMFNSLIWTFFWSGSTELVARAAICQPRHLGGFAVSDISLRCQALHVQWVRRLGSSCPGQWSLFFRHFLRRAFLAEPVLRVFGFGSYTVSSLKCLPVFYRSVLQAWAAIGGQYSVAGGFVFGAASSPVGELTARKAYASLLSAASVPPRCVSKFSSFGPVSWPAVWESISACDLVRPALDTAWKMAHGVLPTADRLVRFGMRVSPYCFCRAMECVEHLFFHCPVASRVLFWFSSLLHQYRRDSPLLLWRYVVLGFPRSLAVPVGFQVLLHLVKHHLWLHRNSIRFDGAEPDPNLVVRRVKAAFRFMLQVRSRTCPPAQFFLGWLALGLFGVVTDAGGFIYAKCLRT